MSKTASHRLQLRTGEWVEVRTKEGILATLEANGRLEEMSFMPEMLMYCGERHGKKIRFNSDAIVLENVVCEGRRTICRRFCLGAILPYWREIWRERAPQTEAKQARPAVPQAESETLAGTYR